MENPRILCLELMETAEATYLTTVDSDGFPQTRAMFNLRRKDQFPYLQSLFGRHRGDFLVFFTTNTSSRKIRHLQANSKASVYYCRPEKRQGLNLVGDIEIVSDPGVKESLWHDSWKSYYPGGSGDPDYAVLRLLPQAARYYHNLLAVDISLSH